MVAVARLLPQILAVWIQLAVLCTEVVVDRRALEDALLDASALTQLVVIYLHHHAEALYEKIPQRIGSISSLWMMMAPTAMIPPMVSEPVSPMNTWAG